MTRSLVRFVLWGAGAVLAVVGLVVAGLYLTLRASLPVLDGAGALAGLGAPVEVRRDALGVATISGASRLDVVRATGFVHAQDRYFQMDLQRRDAAGELAALVGEPALDRDRRRRLHGMRAVARAAYAALSAPRRALLDAYTEGVNAGLDALGVAPFEYLVLRQTPRPWRPEDSLLVIHAMWFVLTDADAERDLARSRLRAHLSPQLYAYLSQIGSQFDAALDGSRWQPLPIPDPGVVNLRGRASVADAVATDLARRTGGDGALPWTASDSVSLGSNAWVVAGRRTQRQQALLANDMHLALRVPVIWYRATLVVATDHGERRVSGVTLPGAPAIVVGSNGRLAWGFTNAYVDTADRIALALDPRDPGRYLSADGSHPFTERVEHIEVAGGTPVRQRVRVTHWGPVDEPGSAAGGALQGTARSTGPADGGLHAVRWLAHAPGATGLGLMALEDIDTVAAALRLAPSFGMPPQNLVAVDALGNIGWTIAGPLALHGAGGAPRRAVASRQLSAAPLPRLPAARYPQILNPEAGYIWTANQRPVGGDALVRLGDGGYAFGARAAQIEQRLRDLPAATAADMLGVQLDDEARHMRRWHRLLQGVLAGAPPSATDASWRRLAGLVQAWSGRAIPHDPAYRWIREYRDSVRAAVLGPLLYPALRHYPQVNWPSLRQAEGVVWQLLEARPEHLLDAAYPDWDALLARAVDNTVKRVRTDYPGPLEARTWAERNAAPIAHPLARFLGPVAALLNMPEMPVPGDLYVPRVMRGTSGASQRFVVSPGHESAGLFHMPGGQSGHPLSPFYRAGFEDWAVGRAAPLLPSEPRHTLTLIPPAPDR